MLYLNKFHSIDRPNLKKENSHPVLISVLNQNKMKSPIPAKMKFKVLKKKA